MKSPFAIVNLLIATVLLSGCCGAGPISARQVKGPFVSPTAKDKQLVAEYRALRKQMEAGVVREAFNLWPESTAKQALMLEGKEPTDAKGLEAARRRIGSLVDVMHAAKDYQEPAPLAIHKAPAKITVDGDLSDEAWKAATPIITWYELNRPGVVKDMPKTSLRILWDDQNVYFGYEADDRTLFAPELKRDAEVYNTDCLELFIMPSRRWLMYWELEFSASGAIMDNLCYKDLAAWGAHARMNETMQGLQVKARVIHEAPVAHRPGGGPIKYIVEVAVPWSELPGFRVAKVGESFYLLAARVDAVPKEEKRQTMKLYTAAPSFVWFHNVACYQQVQLAE